MIYQEMKKTEADACASLAARSFGQYGYFDPFVPDSRRTDFLEALIGCEFRAQRRRAVFLTAREGGRIAAVAMLYPPCHRPPSDLQYVLCGALKARALSGKENFLAWLEMERRAIAPCKALDHGQAWFLNLLCVNSGWKGQGIGSRMLQECILPYVREHHGQTLTLFTNSASNCRFYEKNRFRQFHADAFTYKGQRIDSWSYAIGLQS